MGRNPAGAIEIASLSTIVCAPRFFGEYARRCLVYAGRESREARRCGGWPAGVPSWSTLKPGDVVVSNFNAKSNLQGTGTTIVKLVSNSDPVTFFQGSNLGLTTALAVLGGGFVLVGNVPTTDGKNVVAPGSLLVTNLQGGLVKELKDPNLLDGPWDLTVIDGGRFVRVFVSDVLNGKVARIDLAIGEDGVQMLPGSTNTATVWTLRTDSQ
ncbi:hypothetical protein OKW30_003604 [Paraburkholderia sp. Clong3]|nr:hypothetical protein [Paraburkholderia sp. CI2]